MSRRTLSLALMTLASALAFLACGGSTVTKVTDVIQIRPLAEDDLLAPKFETAEGEILRLGDPVVTDQTITSVLVREVAGTGQYELSVYMHDFGARSWQKVLRRKGLKLALVVKGRVRTIFAASEPVNKAGTQIVIPAVAATKEDADALQIVLDTKRPSR